MAVDGSGNYIVASDDSGALKIYRFTPAGAATTLATYAGRGVSGLTITPAGLIVFVDYRQSQVVTFDPAGSPNNANAIPVSISDNVLEGIAIDPANGRKTVIASNLDIGLPAYPGGPPGLVTTGVAVGKSGTVYVSSDLRNALYAHLQRMPLRFFTATRTGEIQSRLANDVGGVQSVVTDTAASITQNLAVSISTIAAMLLIDWRLTALSLGVLPFFLLLLGIPIYLILFLTALVALAFVGGASTTIIDRSTGETFRGEVPPYSVVVSGTLPGKPLPNGQPGPNLYCAVIVKRVDEKTRSKTSINELLRD